MIEGAPQTNENVDKDKAAAQLEIPLILEEIGIAVEDFESITQMDYEALKEASRKLGERMTELSEDNDGNVVNANRHTVELLARYRTLVENVATAKGTMLIAEQEWDMFQEDIGS